MSIWVATGIAMLGCGRWAVQAQPYGLDSRPAVGSFMNGAFPAAEQSPSGWQAVVAFPNLTFEKPISITPEPGTNRIFVCEQDGKIFFFENNAATSSKTLFLNLTAVTQGGGSGVMAFAFHPEYGIPSSTNRGFVYVYYTYSPAPVTYVDYTRPAYLRLSRFTVPDGSLVASFASEQVLINQFDRHQWHAGGGMFFGPDGFLYLSIGDEGGNNDFYDSAQKIDSGFFSGVLRIDVDMDPARSHPIRRQPASGSAPLAGWPPSYSSNYFIPNDNPWLAANGSILEEFYALGFRNPFRMTHDPIMDRIWVGDVGQEGWEEVDIIEKGGNYQWTYMEGTHAGPKGEPDPLIGVEKSPVYDYPHASGNNCVIGGYVYRGSAFPSLNGKFIFGDNGSGRIWAMTYDGGSPTTVTQLCLMPAPAGSYGLASFGLDQNKEILMSIAGSGTTIYKLAPTGAQPPAPPAVLSQTGVFTNLATLEPNPALIPFTVNSPLWSDNAAKFRWMAVPTNRVIGYTSNGNWLFPTGTVLVKHFELPINDTDPAVRKRLETRLLVYGTNGSWYGLTYKWRADNGDADLLPGALNETNLITTATGGVRTQVWYYPSRQDCRTCHTPNSGQVLGPRTSQFNGTNYYPATGVNDNQLRALNHIGMFSPSLNEAAIPALPQLVSVTNDSASLELRVRSYLQANCAHCHQPGGVLGLFDARFSTPLTNQALVNGTVLNNLGVAGAKIIKPQNAAQSILYVRDSALGTNQMPPLARNVVDTNYIAVLVQWINSLPPTIDLPNATLGRIGNTNDGTSSDSIWDGASGGAYINAARFQTASNLTVAFLRAQVQTISGSYKCAIYTESNSQPSRLLGFTTAVTGPATGWQTFPLAAPVSLTNGQFYWLGIWSDDSTARVYYSSGTGNLRRGQYNFGGWPDPIVTTGQGTANYCIYATGGSAPVFTQTPANRTIAALTPLVVTNGATDADVPLQALTYYLLNPPTNATISPTGVINWTPGSSQGGTTNLLVTAVTDDVTSISNSFQVIVTTIGNAAPVAFNQNLTNAEDTVFPITLTGSDVDGPVTNFVVVTNPVHGVLSGAAPNLIYAPATNYFGPDSLMFRVNDGSLTSAVAAVFITLTNVNDAPEAVADALVRWMSQGVSAPVAALLPNDTDVEGDTLNLITVLGATPPGATITQSNTTVIYWPPFGNTNAGMFDYIITDGNGGYATGLVSVAVVPDPAGSDLLAIALGAPPAVVVTLTGQPGFTYTVQYTDGMEPANWQNLTNATADGLGVIQAFDSNSGTTNRFYRAVRGFAP